jgi:hypothetical protein
MVEVRCDGFAARRTSCRSFGAAASRRNYSGGNGRRDEGRLSWLS